MCKCARDSLDLEPYLKKELLLNPVIGLKRIVALDELKVSSLLSVFPEDGATLKPV